MNGINGTPSGPDTFRVTQHKYSLNKTLETEEVGR